MKLCVVPKCGLALIADSAADHVDWSFHLARLADHWFHATRTTAATLQNGSSADPVQQPTFDGFDFSPMIT
jgi:hypothetical protein